MTNWGRAFEARGLSNVERVWCLRSFRGVWYRRLSLLLSRKRWELIIIFSPSSPAPVPFYFFIIPCLLPSPFYFFLGKVGGKDGTFLFTFFWLLFSRARVLVSCVCVLPFRLPPSCSFLPTAGREDGGDGEEESHRAAWQVQVQEDSKTRVDESHKVFL